MINYENSEEIYKPLPKYGIYKDLNLSESCFHCQTLHRCINTNQHSPKKER